MCVCVCFSRLGMSSDAKVRKLTLMQDWIFSGRVAICIYVSVSLLLVLLWKHKWLRQLNFAPHVVMYIYLCVRAGAACHLIIFRADRLKCVCVFWTLHDMHLFTSEKSREFQVFQVCLIWPLVNSGHAFVDRRCPLTALRLLPVSSLYAQMQLVFLSVLFVVFYYACFF